MTPKILYDGQLYEMWYGGEESDGVTEIGYATSFDGLSWTRYASNPVMGRGPSTWDLADLYCLDVFFDGGMYHMWYGGRLTPTSLIQGVGYAVSPKGMTVSVLPQKDSLDRTKDTVRVIVTIPLPPQKLSFSVEIESPDGSPVDAVDLFDDGTHGDNVALDGVYANEWIPGDNPSYYLDLKLTMHDTLRFEEMNNIAVFGSVTSVLSEESEQPREFYLGQNFPNPFNPSTEIQFSLPQKSYLTLTIFDLLGREVTTLVSEELSAGSYSTRWDAAGMPSGAYLYRLKAGNFVETKKLILLQ